MARLSALTGRAGVHRFILVSLIAVQSVALVALPREAAAQNSGDPKALIADGDKATKTKEWAKARDAYAASNKAAPSAQALEGLANAEFQAKHDSEAYAAYEEWSKLYGAAAAKPKKALADARMKEISERTGRLTIEVSEAGATIEVDERAVGKSPLAALRLSPGPHRVRVTKDGFLPFDQVPNVAVKAEASLKATLEAQSTKARVSVREKNGKPIRVYVDGVDKGDAPWSGELEAGTHEIVGKSPTMASAPEQVTVERGKQKDVELDAASTIATLKITTSDGKGVISLDGKVVGEGTFASDVPAGTHKLRVTRDGYDPFEEEIVLKDKENVARSITLALSATVQTNQVQDERRPLEGIYGGFGILGTFLPGGTHSSMQQTCEASDKPAELTSCSGTTGGLGGGLNGFLGYHWDPVGVEFFAGAQYDQSAPSLEWQASSLDPGIGPDPARTENFSVHRVGGFGAFRLRLTFQGEKIRFSVAGGVGLAFRSMYMVRETVAKDPNLPKDAHAPDSVGYKSLLVNLEPSIQYRLSGSVAVALGFSLSAESPTSFFDDNPTTPADGTRRLGPSGLTTPPYQLASSTQLFIGPFIGMMFGP